MKQHGTVAMAIPVVVYTVLIRRCRLSDAEFLVISLILALCCLQLANNERIEAFSADAVGIDLQAFERLSSIPGYMKSSISSSLDALIASIAGSGKQNDRHDPSKLTSLTVTQYGSDATLKTGGRVDSDKFLAMARQYRLCDAMLSDMKDAMPDAYQQLVQLLA